ncbi:hypothetical protein KGA65_20500 [Ideonella sp. B7]|uniref:hypothetical protein n=1 Tax=Ideonella benzenivorans TaxID=2831643 RepID=UPI001CEC3327|nr:hypothetical protein [Ideonella benzenivorans]MCA6218931.1 hypothetical protein [Ideonella benzenivorans]
MYRLYQASFILALMMAAGASSAAKTKISPSEYDACAEKAMSSVDQLKDGMWAVEAAVKEQCGSPPVREVVEGRLVGMHPYDIVRSKDWRQKFKNITKSEYAKFVERLTVASEAEQRGVWVVGAGLAPHSGGVDEAAFAINTQSGEVFGVMMEDQSKLSSFGFGASGESAPPYLASWLKQKKAEMTPAPVEQAPEISSRDRVAAYADGLARQVEKGAYPACKPIALSIRNAGRSALPENVRLAQVRSMFDKVPAICFN